MFLSGSRLFAGSWGEENPEGNASGSGDIQRTTEETKRSSADASSSW